MAGGEVAEGGVVVAEVEAEVADTAVEVAEVMPRSGAEAAIVRMFRGPGAGPPAFAHREVEVGNGLGRQPDLGAAWVEDSVRSNARPEDRGAAVEDPVVEVPAACRAWVVAAKDLLSVRISIALVQVQVLARELVLVPVPVKARVLALVRAKGLARAVVPRPVQVRDRVAVTIFLVYSHRGPAAAPARFAQAKVVAVFLAVPAEEIALVEAAVPVQARIARAKAAVEFLVARVEEIVPAEAAVPEAVGVRAVTIGLGGPIAPDKVEVANNGDLAAAEIARVTVLIGRTTVPTGPIAHVLRGLIGPTAGRISKTTTTIGGISGGKTTALTSTTSRTTGSTTGITLTNTGVRLVGPVATIRGSSGIGVTTYSTIAGIAPKRSGTVAKTTGIMCSTITGGARLGGIPARPSRSA